MSKFLLVVSWILAACLCVTTEARCRDDVRKDVTFGLTPWLSPQIAHVWVNQLERRLQNDHCIRFKYRSARNFDEYIRNGMNQAYDIIDAPPHIASFLALYNDYRVIVRETYQGRAVIINLAGKGFSDWRQLSGKRFGHPDELAIVTIMAKSMFHKASVTPEYRSYEHHDDVVQALLSGNIDAGVVFSPIYNQYRENLRAPLTAVYTFPAYIDGYVVASRKLDDSLLRDIQNALVDNTSDDKSIWQPWDRLSPADIREFHNTFADTVKFLKNHYQ